MAGRRVLVAAHPVAGSARTAARRRSHDATTKQRQAAKRNVRKAIKAAKKQKTIAKLPTKTHQAGKQGGRWPSASGPRVTAQDPPGAVPEAQRELAGRSKMGRAFIGLAAPSARVAHADSTAVRMCRPLSHPNAGTAEFDRRSNGLICQSTRPTPSRVRAPTLRGSGSPALSSVLASPSLGAADRPRRAFGHGPQSSGHLRWRGAGELCARSPPTSAVAGALEAGVNHLDVAASYGMPDMRLAPPGWRRHPDEFFVATKTGDHRRAAAATSSARSSGWAWTMST